MTHLDMTGYSLAPRQFSTAGEVAENARRVLAFRQKSWAMPVKPILSATAKWPKIEFIGQCLNDYGNQAGSKVVKRWEITPQVRIRDVQMATCRYFDDFTLTDLVSHRRPKPLILARHVAIYIAKTLTLLSLPAIGRQFGDRDHSTILFSVRKIERLRLAGDPIVCNAVQRIISVLVPEPV